MLPSSSITRPVIVSGIGLRSHACEPSGQVAPGVALPSEQILCRCPPSDATMLSPGPTATKTFHAVHESWSAQVTTASGELVVCGAIFATAMQGALAALPAGHENACVPMVNGFGPLL